LQSINEIYMEQIDYILVNCCLNNLKEVVEKLEKSHPFQIAKQPALSLAMLRAEDSVESQEFYLSEALVTDCEVSYNGITGYGICMGDEPVRAYCIAAIDAMLQQSEKDEILEAFLNIESEKIKLKEKEEYNHIQRTRVDFKMMEQA